MEQHSLARSDYVDHNLLFGVLALQTAFIDQRQFIDVCGAWATRRDAHLAELLVEREWINAEERDQIERLVERRLRKHAGNAGDSLRQIHDPPARQALTVAARQIPFIRDVVSEAGLLQLNAFAEDDTLVDDPMLRYEFLDHEPRKGGIGQVWRVKDKELGRVLALKELRLEYRMNAPVRESFFREAQVNAQLTHPNIVPLFDFIRRPGGPAFCTMQFIEGRTLTDAIDDYHVKRRQGKESPLDLRELLTAFIAVCQAVGYAHDHGVLHRDLKGGNVVVGHHGEVFLLDWGLAKLRDGRQQAVNLATTASGMETQHGERLGTPSYMAPEQAAGAVSRITERTDIYGLGAILYEVLTGQPPFPLDVPPDTNSEQWKRLLDELYMRIQEHGPPPPRQLNSAVARPLEAICLKALHRHPEERYASAQAVVQDITSWLAGEPVSAWPDPWHVRARRWSNRNKSWVIATSSVIVAILTMAILWATEQDRQRLYIAQDQTRWALKSEQRAKQAAQKSARLVSEQRDLALGTIRAVSDEIHSELKNRPAMEKPRQKLLEQALAGLKKVAQSADKAEGVDHHLSWVHLEIGRLVLNYSGALAEAKKEFDKAHALAQDAYSARPTRDTRHDLAASYHMLGDVSLLYGQVEAARKYYLQGLELAEVIAADRADLAGQRDLAAAYDKMGELNLKLEIVATARDYFAKGMDIRKALADRDQAVLGARHALANSYHRMGAVSLRANQLDKAESYFEQNLELAEALAAADQTNTAAQRILAASYDNLGDFKRRMNDVAEARDYYHKGLEIHERLVAIDKASIDARHDLALSCQRLGELSSHRDQVARAKEFLARGLEIAGELANVDQANAAAQRDLAAIHVSTSQAHFQAAELATARSHLQTAHDITAKLRRAAPSSLEVEFDLMKIEKALGLIDYESLDFQGALDWLSRVAHTANVLAKQDKLAGTPFAVWPKVLSEEIADWRETETLLDHPDLRKKRPVASQRTVLELLVKRCLKQGKSLNAQNAAAQLAQLQPHDRWSLWQAARAHGMIVQALPAADPQREILAGQAVELVRQAIAQGFASGDLLKYHAHMAGLQDRPAFQALLKKLDSP
jgi:serine/threonine protein kinase